jgi:hypothetical protein
MLEQALAEAERLRNIASAPQVQFVTAAGELMGLSRWLEAADLWEAARSTRASGREPRIDVLSIAQQALCLSKERVQLTLDEAFQRAVQVLTTHGDIGKTQDQETLGIAGGIYKRYWDAFRHSRSGGQSASAAARRAQARSYRAQILTDSAALETRAQQLAQAPGSLEPANHPWWILVTLAEAHFGLAPTTYPPGWSKRRRDSSAPWRACTRGRPAPSRPTLGPGRCSTCSPRRYPACAPS